MKVEFKKALVPICFFYFALFFSFNLVFPYFTLQLRTLGLTLDDAALIGEPFLLVSHSCTVGVNEFGPKYNIATGETSQDITILTSLAIITR